MNLLLLCFTAILLSGCAGFRSNQPVYIDEAFRPYVTAFEQRHSLTVNVSIVFKDIEDEDVAGQCWRGYNRLIEIDTPYWNVISELGREQLVEHELGHCVLNLDHDERLGTVGAWNNVPLSIMYPIHFGDETYYRDNREYYLQELGHGLERHYYRDFTR